MAVRVRKRILSTGSSGLDSLINGGVMTGATYDFFGESGTGKTQICFQLCVSASFDERFEGRVVFVDTVGTFRPERVKEVAHYRGIGADSVFDRLEVFSCRSVGEQLTLLDRLSNIDGGPVKLVLLDTISDNFLYEYHGDDRIVVRQAFLAHHLLDLARFAVKMDASVVLTNGLRADTFGGVREVASSALDHGSHVKVMLTRTERGRFAELVRPKRHRRRWAEFRIGPEGITDAFSPSEG